MPARPPRDPSPKPNQRSPVGSRWAVRALSGRSRPAGPVRTTQAIRPASQPPARTSQPEGRKPEASRPDGSPNGRGGAEVGGGGQALHGNLSGRCPVSGRRRTGHPTPQPPSQPALSLSGPVVAARARAVLGKLFSIVFRSFTYMHITWCVPDYQLVTLLFLTCNSYFLRPASNYFRPWYCLYRNPPYFCSR